MGKWVFVVALVVSVFAQGRESAVLIFPKECILHAVAKYKHIALKTEVPYPAVYFETDTSLAQFQDAVEPQWHMRPDGFLNVYVFAKNEIYIMDDAAYYIKMNRFIDDSLAHELTHYLQVKYQGLKDDDDVDSAESDAISTQTWFRETFMIPGAAVSPCEY